MKIKVHWLHELEEPFRSYFCSLLSSQIEISFGPTTHTDFEILVGGRPQRADLEKSKKLTTLIIPFVGLPPNTRKLLFDFPFLHVHNIHFNDSATAEMAITLMLSAVKSILPIDRQFRNHNWEGRMRRSPLLTNKHVLILGYGAIGKKVAKICHALEMRISAIRRTCDLPYKENEVEVYPLSSLDSLLTTANVVIICLPETKETHGLLTGQYLQLLPEESTIVNIGRAAIIEEEAFFLALKERKIYAGLDVWYNYPQQSTENCPPSQYPFHELPNVVMSPHRASRSEEAEYLRVKHVANLLNQRAEGKEMPNKMDIYRGY